eukprot:1161403-Pelagomonas_calceolata.AAC.6
MQPLKEGEEPPMVPEPIKRDDELELPSMEDVAAKAGAGSGEAPQLPAEEGGAGAGEGAQAQGSKLLHKARGGGRGPMEVSEDTAESIDEKMEDGERQRASAYDA